jgi:formate C-acetyltransferase
MMTPKERVAELRRRLLERKDDDEVMRLMRSDAVTARSLRSSEGFASWQIRRGLLTRDRLKSVRFDIDDLELMAGRPLLGCQEETRIEEEEAQTYLSQYPQPGGQTGHCELDLDPVMSLGIGGLSREIGVLRSQATNGTAETYQSFLYSLEGLAGMIENAATVVEEAMPAASVTRREELREIADSCRRIACDAPQSFRDGIQLLWFVILGVMQGDQAWLVVPGHLDRTLLPFLEADLGKGRLTPKMALLLIESLYLLLNGYIPDGLAISVMVGGRDAQRRDVTNELSYLCLEALRRTKLIYPTVGICWHEGTPQELIDLAIDLVGKGHSTPAFFGDETIQKGLRALGVPPAEACRYVNSTCVEITPGGGSNVWVASLYHNTCQMLLGEIAVQAENPAPTFEVFLARYRKRLVAAIEQAVKDQNRLRLERQMCGRKPLQSVFTRDCINRGRDIDDGGAVYNWVECSFVGLANLIDSLYVLREEVYHRRRMTLAEMKALLDANYEGHEEIRLRLMNAYPKYGQDDPDVDHLFGETVRMIIKECGRFTMEPDESPYVPGAFVWVMHERLGRETGATPDGRKAGFPFADGCGPAQGRERKGPTAAILSTTSWEHSPMLGGLAYNMKFNTSLFDSSRGFDRLRDLVLTFLHLGGFETQVNVVDLETLRAARENPEEYRDLVVRIGGYTDYFTRLSPEMQDELMLRTEFSRV